MIAVELTAGHPLRQEVGRLPILTRKVIARIVIITKIENPNQDENTPPHPVRVGEANPPAAAINIPITVIIKTAERDHHDHHVIH